MREYSSGTWGFALIWGFRASVFPRALTLAVPNALIALLLSFFIEPAQADYDLAQDAITLLAGFTTVMSFILGFRSNIAYRRWWEGGTLLQQTRGEWFNAFSSLIAFSSLDPAMDEQVEAYQHMLVRFMSLLFCSALQQVSPNKNAEFEIVKLDGIDPESIRFLRQTSDQVEVVLQWIQRSTMLNAASGVLTAPPPILSRAFQELSRGIVNLQNARKIADFPFPFPYAQTSIVMLLIHWVMCPVLSCMVLKGPIAAVASFLLIFFLWCLNYIAFDLENPFGTNDNDLPMAQFQSDWNKSLVTLIVKRAQHPPDFTFDPLEHRAMAVTMSNGCCVRKRPMSMSEHIHGIGSETPSRNTSVDDCVELEAEFMPPEESSSADAHAAAACQVASDVEDDEQAGQAIAGSVPMSVCPFPSHAAAYSDISAPGGLSSATVSSSGDVGGCHEATAPVSQHPGRLYVNTAVSNAGVNPTPISHEHVQVIVTQAEQPRLETTSAFSSCCERSDAAL